MGKKTLPPVQREYEKCTVVGDVVIGAHGSPYIDVLCKSCPPDKAKIRRVHYCSAFIASGGYRCKSCGNTGKTTTHGMSRTPEYRGMINAKGRASRDTSYIAKGRDYDEKHLGKFEQFNAVMGPRPEGKPTVDRIDNSKGYVMIESADGTLVPNIRWASYREQANNTSRNIPVEIDNVTYTLTQAAEKFGVSPHALHYHHVKKHRTIEESVRRIRTGERDRPAPSKRPAPAGNVQGIKVGTDVLTLAAACDRLEVSYRQTDYWMKKGLDFDAAVKRVKNPPETIVQLAARHGVTTGGIQHHMRKGLTAEEAVDRMLNPPETVVETAARHGLSIGSVRNHLRRGRTLDQAIAYLVAKRDQQQGAVI